ncbi:fibronectin type III domain-containing protein [Ancylobacter dichloromethanicus]
MRLADLSLANITARDASALVAWQAALDAAGSDSSGGDDSTDDDTAPDTDDGNGDGATAAYATAWSASDVYTGGDRVSIGNLVYQAGWWTQGEDPSAGSSVWTLVGYMDTTPVVPDAPEDLYAAGTSASTTVLVWDAAEVNGVGTVNTYQIYQDGNLIGTTSSTYYKVTGLDPSTSYSFTIVAVDEAGGFRGLGSAQREHGGGRHRRGRQDLLALHRYVAVQQPERGRDRLGRRPRRRHPRLRPVLRHRYAGLGRQRDHCR